ncbi:hypothetical protein [Mesorhizobium sp.]|uniref:hypothetical protein n=1 Tax=Mesorhizobium sp. TaxID=1871066 RepID=UPI000FE5031B|nr:hypothetical protein [Mesorhizobium sp.]RWE34990.1 MAG: hypothetical protein EOS77_08435 [Mesorhizobium sp.]
MTKDESEKTIRHLCHVWAQECGIALDPTVQPSFAQFKLWLNKKGYSHYLDFRSVAGADYDAEMWFDHEFKQTWRN